MAIPFTSISCGLALRRLSVPDSGNNMGVGAASAEITAHLLTDVRIGTGVPFTEQADRRADLAGRAVPALESVVPDECLLHGVELVALCQAFNGCNLGPHVHDREAQARIDAPAIDQNRT